MTGKRFVVVGGDAAGMSAAGLVKRRRPEVEVEAYEMGDYTSYGACGMPYHVSGDVPELDDLVVVTPAEFVEKRGIQVFMRHKAEKIDPDQKVVLVRDLNSDSVREVPYDDLLLATGARPIVPPGLDLSLEGVFALRGLPDAAEIKAFAARENSKKAVIIGTGYIGMEMAEALARVGLEVVVLGRRPRVLPTYEPEIAEVVEQELGRSGVELLNGAEASGIEPGSKGGLKLTLSDGRELEADLILVGAGVSPRSDLAAEAGLELGVKKAIKVDRTQKTSAPHIWAAGDCAEAHHALTGQNTYIPLALTANRQGRVAGSNVAGIPDEFPGILGTSICKIFDLAASRTGLGQSEAEALGLDTVKVVVDSRSRAHYYPGGSMVKSVLIVEKGTQKLWGAQMVGADGASHRINTWAAALAAGLTLKQVHGLDLAYAPPFSPVWDPVLIASEIALKKVK